MWPVGVNWRTWEHLCCFEAVWWYWLQQQSNPETWITVSVYLASCASWLNVHPLTFGVFWMEYFVFGLVYLYLHSNIETCILFVVFTHLALLLLGRATPGFQALFSTWHLIPFTSVCLWVPSFALLKVIFRCHSYQMNPNVSHGCCTCDKYHSYNKTTFVCPKHRNSKSTLPETSKPVDFITQNLLGPKLSSQKFTLPTRSAIRIWVLRCCAASRIWNVWFKLSETWT